ncbi:TNR6 factor, partial [Centropus unirufus]|nr:TNR6 factor [Centropus unirufus]
GFVKSIDCPTDTREHCVPCENGKEYMDHVNDLDKCKRCNSCDSIFGLEVSKNCSPVQNTECTCAKNYFCDSPESCSQCELCTTCESGLIEKECTPTTDTVCRTEGTILNPSSSSICCIFRGCCNCIALHNEVDLSSHVPGIVDEMTLREVKMFVRHHQVPEPVIDQTVQDYYNNTSELKIKLFQVWYQRHGIKGAYSTLIGSLRELKMCAIADKIEEKLKAAVSSCREGGQSHSDDTEQSKTYIQESRNSCNDSSDSRKIFSGSLEET